MEKFQTLEHQVIAICCWQLKSSGVRLYISLISPDRMHVKIHQECFLPGLRMQSSFRHWSCIALSVYTGRCRGWTSPCFPLFHTASELDCSWLNRYLPPLACANSSRSPEAGKLSVVPASPSCRWLADCISTRDLGDHVCDECASHDIKDDYPPRHVQTINNNSIRLSYTRYQSRDNEISQGLLRPLFLSFAHLPS